MKTLGSCPGSCAFTNPIHRHRQPSPTKALGRAPAQPPRFHQRQLSMLQNQASSWLIAPTFKLCSILLLEIFGPCSGVSGNLLTRFAFRNTPPLWPSEPQFPPIAYHHMLFRMVMLPAHLAFAGRIATATTILTGLFGVRSYASFTFLGPGWSSCRSQASIGHCATTKGEVLRNTSIIST